ncbi:cryptochrome/photolyase family protein [Pedobacter mucosus]|uniref:cryptochrome/photolyase family protein n=1 Tax=Pedobacter mucosus TaxID=2895286 RepID=UPI001EE4C0C6|nr:cryptochrome/photolyase family protein [Pedobacter mucosus]UKT64533.1 cryptochrome/photolyase family protein [Pedobacter mucosus]
MDKIKKAPNVLRLILGDQLNIKHSWFKTVDKNVLYVLMEIRSETDYVWHHIQKVLGFFAAMRHFAEELKVSGHQLKYIHLSDEGNLQSFEKNLIQIIRDYNITHFEYQLPDEYRLDEEFKSICNKLLISSKVYDTEHFFSTRTELANFFDGKKNYLMENFYHYMRKKHHILMDNDSQPVTGKWNYDIENRKKIPSKHVATSPYIFENDLSDIYEEIKKTDIVTIGTVNPTNFIWPITRAQCLKVLKFFITECLPLFGTYQDSMTPNDWSLYHSRISFAMNSKMISPLEVVNAAIEEWKKHPDEIGFNQLEGFVRQIIGWREYMRGMYWLNMPDFETTNFFNNKNKLPDWYWTGKTKMNCLKYAIGQSLNFAYAHHIQRLMVTGNFALLAGTDPDEVDQWYLGIYIDAIQWVEITNTRGMSQFADGGMIGTKPYVSSASYINKMSHYCGTCYYDKDKKTGDKACPFNSLYWNFYDQHSAKLSKNPRIGMMYKIWDKMQPEKKSELLNQAKYYLENINDL